MLEIEDGRFATQILYRSDGREFVLGYIADFEEKGVTKKYKKTDGYYMYKGFWHSHKASTNDGKTWTKGWDTREGAIRKLLKHHGLDQVKGIAHVLPCPETFKKHWKGSDYNEPYERRITTDDD